MADRRTSQPNVLRQAIREQLESPSNIVSSEQRPYAPVEKKSNNLLSNLFTSLSRKKKQEGLVVVDQNQKMSAKNVEPLKANDVEFEHFDLESLNALAVPQNRKQEISKDKELQEVSGKVKQFNGKIEEDTQNFPIAEVVGVSQDIGEDLPIAKEVSLFNGKIEEDTQNLPIAEVVGVSQDIGEDLPIANEVSLFEGKIEEDTQNLPIAEVVGVSQDIGEDVPIAKEVSLIEGKIEDNLENLPIAEVVGVSQDISEDLPIAKEVSLFDEEILDNGKELPIAKEISEFQGEIKDKGKELQASVDGGGVGGGQYKGKIEELDKDPQKVILEEDTKQFNKRKADEATIASSQGKVLVEVTADEEGKIVDINSYNLGAFTKPKATILATKKGVSAKSKIQAKINRAKKSARHRSQDQNQGISLIR